MTTDKNAYEEKTTGYNIVLFSVRDSVSKSRVILYI
jgi:hypothetical protein